MKSKMLIILTIFIGCALLSGVTLGVIKYKEFVGKKLVTVPANSDDSSKLLEIQMKEDLDYLVKTLEQDHPYTVKGFDENQSKLIKEAYTKISKPMGTNDFYFIANEIVASIKDGHTTLNLVTENNMQAIMLPFKWLKEGMIVSSNTDQLTKGDKIISIGGKTEKQLYEYADKLIPGENQYWKKNRAQSSLIIEPVLRHYNLINNKNTVDIEIERNGTIIKLSLPIIPFPLKSDGGQSDWVRWNIEKESSLGILYLDKCINDEKYTQTLNEFFKAVKDNNIKNVALDLRKNSGGDSTVMNTFLQYLDIYMYKNMGSEVRVSQNAKEQRENYQSTALGYYKYDSKSIKNNRISETDLIYNGNLYVLTSPNTFSSANIFTLTLKDNNLAKVLGEPTGNATTRYGDLLSFTLPNSKMKFGLSHKIWKRPNANAGWQDAVYPDIEVYTTREDIINGKDPQLERLRQECAKKIEDPIQEHKGSRQSAETP